MEGRNALETRATETNYRNELSAHNCLREKEIRRCISHCLRHPLFPALAN